MTRVLEYTHRTPHPRWTSRRLLPRHRTPASLYAAALTPTTLPYFSTPTPFFLLPLLSCSHPFRWRRSAKPPRLCVRRILTQLCLPNAISRVVKAEIKADINSLLTLILCAIIDLRTGLRSYLKLDSRCSAALVGTCAKEPTVCEKIHFRDLFRNLM